MPDRTYTNYQRMTYGGRRFRSVLEALYAKAFDQLGWTWHYELHTFQLPAGRYTPDFYLQELGLWLEVKPTAPTELELTKLRQLHDWVVAHDDRSQYGVSCALAVGKPWQALKASYWHTQGKLGLVGPGGQDFELVHCRRCGQRDLVPSTAEGHRCVRGGPEK